MTLAQVTPNRQNYVEIGKIKENLVTEVVFPVSDLGDGSGNYTVVFQRPKDSAPYPVTSRVEWPSVIWEVGAADTAKPGTGKAEVRWYGDGDKVGKSKTYIVRVTDGLADPTEAPEAWEGYVGQVARNAEAAKTAAVNAAAYAQSAGADADKAEAALKALEDGIASGDFRGEKGEKGDKGDTGPKGEKGDKGDQGPAGDTTAADAAAKAAQAAAVEAQEAAEASAGSAASAAESVGGFAGELAETKAALATAQKDLAKAQRAIRLQAKLTQGQVWDFEEDEQAAYQRTVPSGAHAAGIKAYGGTTRRGRNLVDYQEFAKNRGINCTPEYIENGVRITATSDDAYTRYTVSEFQAKVTVTPGETITLSWDSDNNISGYVYIFPDGKISGCVKANNNAHKSLQLVVPEGTSFVTYRFGVDIAGNTITYKNIMLERGETIHTWEPYAADLVSAEVDEVRVTAIDGAISALPIPASVRSLPGYGWSAGSVANTVARTEDGWQYVQRVGSVDLGAQNWSSSVGANAEITRFSAPVQGIAKVNNSATLANIICAIYDTATANQTYLGKTGISQQGNATYIYVYDPAYTYVASFKAAMSGVPLYYELAAPITTDITALMGDALDAFDVEPGGTITFHSPAADDGFELDVPAKIQYITKLSEVTADA